MIKRKLNLTDSQSPIQPESRETSPTSTFSDIFKQFEAMMKSKFSQMLRIKSAEIVDSVSASMESMLKESEVNLNMSMNSATNLSITESLGEIKSEIEAVKESSAGDGQVLAYELLRLHASVGTQIHTFQTQIKILFDDVKKVEEELKLKNVAINDDLEAVKKSVNVQSDELTAD